MKHLYITAAVLALGFLATPSYAEQSGCHSCRTVTTTSTTSSDPLDRFHALQPGGSCNWVNCKVESALMQGNGPDPITRTRTYEVCDPKTAKAI